MDQIKRCTKCGEDKPLGLFSVDAQKKDGYRSSCKDCDKLNRDNQKVASKKWRQSNKDHVRGYKQKYYQERLARPRPPKDPTAPARAKKAWKQRNPAYMMEDRARRRSREQAPAWAKTESMRHYYVLARYLSKATGVSWHVDHVVPLRGTNVCGLHNEFNLTILPGAFNMTKSNSFDWK